MIYDELKNYVTQVSSPETIALFDNAVDVFEKYSFEGYMDIFDRDFGDSGDNAECTVLDNLLATLRTLLTYLTSMQGITLSEDTPISMLTTVADALFELPYYIDKQVLIDILSSDVNDSEKVCVLLPLVTPHSTEVYLPLITKVNEFFISNFRGQITTVQETETNHEMIKKHVDAYLRLREKVAGTDEHYCDKFFIQTESIGLPYIDYIKQYKIDKKAELCEPEGDRLNKIAMELVGLTTLSSDGYNNPLVIIRQHLSDLYQDINITTKLDIAISKIIMAYTR